MGNRCIIATRKGYDKNGPALYLHWNGGRDSVEGFLLYCRLQNFRMDDDGGYWLSRLSQVVGNFFDGGLSVGVVPARCGAGYDNGVYIIGNNWEIVGREEYDGPEQSEYNIYEFVEAVNESQPAKQQIEPRILHSLISDNLFPMEYDDKIKLCKPGTRVYVLDSLYGTYNEYEILGCGSGVVNGQDVTGVPFYNFMHYKRRFSDPVPDSEIDKISSNINSYILKNTQFCFA